MIAYKDKTWCSNRKCARHGVDCDIALTREVQKAADEWWGKGPGMAPIFLYHGKLECFVEKETK